MLDLSFDYAFLLAVGTRGGILVAWHSNIWVASHVHHANNTLSLSISLIGSSSHLGISQQSMDPKSTMTRSPSSKKFAASVSVALIHG
jgi:hypothetical protein